MENQPQRKTESALMEVHYKLQGHGKSLTECLERLATIGRKLIDESGNLQQKEPIGTPSNRMPGIIMNLENDCDGFSKLISDIDRAIKKIEPLI